ncbi:MAG: OsmC family peroxiredoxin [Trueperaceae bacterium]|nr:OsmC family peroxiredoxin [Truepera sp.]HRQ11158.1 OsmC family peroxiredoxin [Trueperaceae bacterium]
MPITKADASWKGSLKEGKGVMKVASGAYSGPFSFASRFGSGAGPETGTNPEELLAAAHAGCFSMALSGRLADAGHVADSIDTTASVTMERVDGAQTISKSHLVTRVKVAGMDDATFQGHVRAAAESCPVSRALAGVAITVEATLA